MLGSVEALCPPWFFILLTSSRLDFKVSVLPMKVFIIADFLLISKGDLAFAATPSRGHPQQQLILCPRILKKMYNCCSCLSPGIHWYTSSRLCVVSCRWSPGSCNTLRRDCAIRHTQILHNWLLQIHLFTPWYNQKSSHPTHQLQTPPRPSDPPFRPGGEMYGIRWDVLKIWSYSVTELVSEPVTKGCDLKWDTLPQNQTPNKLASKFGRLWAKMKWELGH